MPVDKQVLDQCILEAAGDDAEMADFLRKRYASNDAAATRFIGGFMRNSDYTTKSQALATDRKTFESAQADLQNQITTARAALEKADTEKGKILGELASKRISVAKAKELMTVLQEKYSLTDEDLPGMSDLIETRKTGSPVDTAPDLTANIDQRLTDLEKRMEDKFAKTLMPELSAMAQIPMIINEIVREHKELTGKDLSYAEQQDILARAKKGEGSLRAVWENKYQVTPGEWGQGLRSQKHDEGLIKAERGKWDAEQADKLQKAALDVVQPSKAPDFGQGPGISLAFRQQGGVQGRDHYHPPNAGQFTEPSSAGGTPTLAAQPGQHVRSSNAGRVPAAQRAAQKFVAQRMGTQQVA